MQSKAEEAAAVLFAAQTLQNIANTANKTATDAVTTSQELQEAATAAKQKAEEARDKAKGKDTQASEAWKIASKNGEKAESAARHIQDMAAEIGAAQQKMPTANKKERNKRLWKDIEGACSPELWKKVKLNAQMQKEETDTVVFVPLYNLIKSNGTSKEIQEVKRILKSRK